jgi:prevent-host-death family protein
MCYIVHMKKISIRDLHLKTGEWVRRAASGDRLVVTDRGRPIASLSEFREDDFGTPYSERRILPEFDALEVVSGDSTRYVSEDRDRG